MTVPETIFLDLEDLVEIAEIALGARVLVRDYGLLESAAARPRTSVFGRDAYPTVLGKAAALCESLVRNHALVDGNKRLGWLATWVFCDLNGVTSSPSQDEAVDLIVDIAEGKLPSVDEIVARLHQFTSLASEGSLPDARLSPDASPELYRDPD